MLAYFLVAGGALWAIWQLVRPLFERSPLDIVPGPPAKSILSGTFHRNVAVPHILIESIFRQSGAAL